MSALRLLLRILLATVAILACGAFTRTGAGPRAFLASAFDATASQATSIDPAQEPSHHFRDRAPRADLKAVESDLDDDRDDDPRCDFAADDAPASRCLTAPAREGRADRSNLLRDTSRFAAGDGLPRGPPA